ncbi:MAG: S41 family peptidase [Ekhidna sp.]
MKRLSLLAVLIGNLSFGQQIDTLKTTVLSPKQLKEDFQLYRKMLEETHPGLYRYTSKEHMQSTLDSVASTLVKPKSFYQFYKDILHIGAQIRCTHSYAFPSKKVSQYSMNQISTVPFYTYGMNEKVYVLFNGSMNEGIKPGFEILSINGNSIESIKEQFYTYAWSDASIESSKIRFFAGSLFWMFYHALVDKSERFDITFKDLDGKLQMFHVKALTPRTSMANYKKNPVNKSILKKYKQGKRKMFKLGFPKDADKTATISISVFGGDSEEDAQQKTRKFMDMAIKKMEKVGVESLIIDLRSNQGGWDIVGSELLSYLVKSDEPFEYWRKGIAIIKDTTFLKYTEYSYQDWLIAKKELKEQPDGTFLVVNPDGPNPVLTQPKPNRFKGDLYFLIQETTGSAASEFAGAAKSRNLGTFVGSETNAAYDGGNSSTFIKMTLPNSGIYVNSPLVAGYLNVKPQKIPNRGVLPHHEVNFIRDDLLIRYDRQLEFVKGLIRKNDKKTESP